MVCDLCLKLLKVVNFLINFPVIILNRIWIKFIVEMKKNNMINKLTDDDH